MERTTDSTVKGASTYSAAEPDLLECACGACFPDDMAVRGADGCLQCPACDSSLEQSQVPPQPPKAKPLMPPKQVEAKAFARIGGTQDLAHRRAVVMAQRDIAERVDAFVRAVEQGRAKQKQVKAIARAKAAFPARVKKAKAKVREAERARADKRTTKLTAPTAITEATMNKPVMATSAEKDKDDHKKTVRPRKTKSKRVKPPRTRKPLHPLSAAIFLSAGTSIVFLIAALTDEHSDGFYHLLRWVVSPSACFVAYLAWRRGLRLFAATVGLCAGIFNPVVLVHLDRDVWLFLDAWALVIVASSFFWVVRKRKDRPPFSPWKQVGVILAMLICSVVTNIAIQSIIDESSRSSSASYYLRPTVRRPVRRVPVRRVPVRRAPVRRAPVRRWP
ncbi:MAG: hypothetical protein HN341_08420 [Verrucomicrobia bacterium]|nr:hypothetical protein [Verrucomicrobiota bacterium]